MTISEDLKLHVEDVSKSYGDKLVLDDIDLKVKTGEFVTVVGPSGCGKSTLLRLILGQEQPDAGVGKLMIDGQSAGIPDTNRGIVYQKYSLFPHLTVLQNVLLGKRLKKGPWWLPQRASKADTEEAMAYLNRVRLTDAAHKYPHELSGGMQQRVAIAQAIITQPPILLMDEPFGALDPDTRTDVQLYLLELWEELGMTIFFVTHDMHEACFVGTRLLVLSQYYSDGRGNGAGVKRGGKIVADYALPAVAASTEVQSDPRFVELLQQIKRDGFDPESLQHIREFNLRHPDAFQTVSDELIKPEADVT